MCAFAQVMADLNEVNEYGFGDNIPLKRTFIRISPSASRESLGKFYGCWNGINPTNYSKPYMKRSFFTSHEAFVC